MIGSINLKGKTLSEAQEMIRSLYDRDYLVNPQVTVFILDYSKRSVNVLGSVNSPGVVVFPQETGLTLLDAIARAGGFSRLADKKRVKLTRASTEGKTENYTINADEIMQGATNESWVLQKDDVISVPERVL
jgi:polysaccharide export outer membrane protein